MKIQDQSAHALPCRGGCPRLYWDRSSYESVTGGRAVSIAHSTGSKLRYCAASYSTMAVSHVWSHGQGGRPEDPLEDGGGTGFNSCLHRRYSSIAASRGCDSYWMDTPCIPQDHHLRSEAIREINTVFAQSRLTLVCDRLIPIAREGLRRAGIDDADADRYLDVVQERVASRQTGAQWSISSFSICPGSSIMRSASSLSENA